MIKYVLFLLIALQLYSKEIPVNGFIGLPPIAYEQVDGAWYATRFVNTTGGGDGSSDASAWSLSQAFSSAVAGDIVHVKKGNYGNQLLTQSADGTALNKIIFRGYDTAPNDIVSSNGSTFSRGNTVNSAIMPLITGVQTAENRGQGTAFTINGDYVVIENFQFIYQNMAGYSTGTGVEWVNIVTDVIGDMSGVAGGGFDDYNGYGIRLSGPYNKVRNSLIQNCGAEGIHMRDSGNYCTVSYTEVFCNNTTNPLDYYILSSGTHDNLVEFSTSYRTNGLDHLGHGQLTKFGAYNNTFRNCTIIGTGIESTFGSHDNLWENMTIIGWWDSGGDNANGGINFGKGVYNEEVRNATISNFWLGISFASWDEGGAVTVDASSNSVFKNIEIFNCDFAIAGNEFENNGRAANNHKFYNLTISDISNRLFRMNRPLVGFEIYDSLFHNVNALQVTSGGYGFTLDTGTVFTNCNVSGTGLTASALTPYVETSITSITPPFTNSASGDFSLTSAVLNIGTYSAENPTDKNGNSRLGLNTLGANVYGESDPAPVIVNGTNSILTTRRTIFN